MGASGSCKTMPWKKKEPEEPAPMGGEAMKVPVGTVQLVRPDSTFVLIRSTRFLQVEPGTNLTSFNASGMETARLEVSPARKGQFITADILSGTPGSGDQVLMDYVVPTPQTEAERQAATANEVQVLE